MFKIEIKAILESLKIAWDSEFRQVEVECDNVLVVETILAGGAVNSRMSELRIIHQLLGRDWRVRLRHISRDHNRVTDHMTRLPSLYYNEVQIFIKILVSIKNLHKSDIDLSANITW
ncbi:hypothetical protein Golax_011947 [Gossypium laxum]|uniref:RNase H type-1 domain-containing protein n=1 Tax=Gossypium laxum TaxID=34288 RepID=A0A7J8ZMD8_9ROSI|nr:hypothetical protein [Gossypium laxum]